MSTSSRDLEIFCEKFIERFTEEKEKDDGYAVVYAWNRIVDASNYKIKIKSHEFAVNTTNKIAVMLTSIRTTGKRAQMFEGKCVVQNTNVIGANGAMKEFLKNNSDYTMIIPCGSETHQQCIFYKRTNTRPTKTSKAAFIKIYDPNGESHRKLCATTLDFLQTYKYTTSSQDIIYVDALHGLKNDTNAGFCAHYVWLEILLAFMMNQTPFNRVELKFYDALKGVYGNVGRLNRNRATITNLAGILSFPKKYFTHS